MTVTEDGTQMDTGSQPGETAEPDEAGEDPQAERRKRMRAAEAIVRRKPEISVNALTRETGLSYHFARLAKEDALSRKRQPGARKPVEEHWQAVLNFLHANPGRTFTRKEIHEATGVPPSTLTYLWRQKFGHTPVGALPGEGLVIPEEAEPGPEPAPLEALSMPAGENVRVQPGARITLTVAGRLQDGTLAVAADDGFLYALSLRRL